MTNQDDTFAELAAARAYITRGKSDDALDCIDQAVRLITAEFAALLADVAEAEKLSRPRTVWSEGGMSIEPQISNNGY